jgi:hypothetical protein
MKQPDNADAKAQQFAIKKKLYMQRVQAEVDRLRKHLDAWIEHHTDNNEVEITTALLEVAFERKIDLLGEEDALDLVQSAFRRTAKKFRPPLQ